MNVSAYVGESALRISGWSTMPFTPQAPIAMNQAIITGPKSRPTAAVPWRWTANSATMMTAVIGTIHSSNSGVDDLDALDRRQHRDRGGDHAVAEEQRGAEDAERGQRHDGATTSCPPPQRRSSVMSAMMPPSPSLSARITRVT